MRDWFFVSNPLPGVCPHKNTQNFLPQPVANIKRKWKQIMSVLEKSFSLLLLLLGLWISINVKCIPKSRSQFLKVVYLSFPGDSDGKELACNAGDLGSMPGSGRSPGEGNGCPFQYSCLENSMNREAWQAIVHGVTNNWTQLKQLSTHSKEIKRIKKPQNRTWLY